MIIRFKNYTHITQVMHYAILLFVGVALLSCKQNNQPKPEAFLSLNYPEPSYQQTDFENLFLFDKNTQAQIVKEKHAEFKIVYPEMKATIYVNYKPVANNNLNALLQDAQKLTYNHAIKATEIIEHPYINPEKKVYGMFYNVTGDAATNVQFYATDSIKNFLVATLYFYTKPNYDSIYPATKYIEKDMKRIMESIEWKN